ncbi:MAG: hypothetical protein R3F59_27135 [Myxococcota bacterium]
MVLGSLVVPTGHKPIGLGGGAILLLPGTYFFGAFVLTQGLRYADTDLGWLVTLASVLVGLGTLIVFLVSLPYVLYLLARILNPELVQFHSWRYRLGFAGIVCFVGLCSVIAGLAHPLYLTCGDFTLSGNDRPSNCTDASAAD